MSSRAFIGWTACAAAGLVVCLVFAVREPGGTVRAPGPSVALAAEREAPGTNDARIDARAGPAGPLVAFEVAPHADRARRAAGLPPPPPDAPVAVHGLVLDADTGRPVQGITLGFLSRRPRTVTARTNGEGVFQTRPELTSGVVSVAHAPDSESPVFAARWEIEPTTFLAPAPGMEVSAEPLVLRARAPERVLDVDVRLPDGAPAVGAAVSLTVGRRDGSGRFDPLSRAYEESDGTGRARFALFGGQAWEATFRVEAEHGGTLASDVIFLDPPISRAPRTLGLLPGGVVRVVARNDDGLPVAGVSLWVATHEDSDAVRGRAGETDARGECSFGALRPGCYTISAIHPATGSEIRREIDLPRGAQESVEVPVSVAGMRLRLSGTVADESGAPLVGVAVRAQAPGERWVSLATGTSGRFEFWGAPVESILFAAGGGFLDDRYEPEFLSVPCGTSGFVVRRLAEVPASSWACQVSDRATSELVRAATVTLVQGEGFGATEARPEARQGFTTTSGFVQLTFKLRNETAYAVDAPGYLRTEGLVADLIAASAGRGMLRVELDPGFERRVEVRDRATRRNIPGATIASGALLSERTNEQGAAVLRADVWPATVRVEAAGYASIAWDPLAAGFPGDVIWLEPLRGDR